MNRRLSAIVVIATGFLGFAAAAQAAMMEHEIDADHSFIIFKVMNRDVGYVLGRFDGISGTISIDSPFTPKTLEFDLDVKAGSVDTNSKKRDRDLAGKDFLDSSRHREIKFKSKACKQLEEKGMYEITGDLTILGTTKEITVPFHLIGTARESGSLNRIGGETTFTIKRSDYGMTNMQDSVADEVTLMVNLQAVSKIVPAG